MCRRLPEWNERIVALESPPSPLEAGDRWTVQMRVLGNRFNSVSEVIELDRARRRFVYRSKPDDENPSHTLWQWEVEEGAEETCTVRVEWSIRPKTLSRRIVRVMRRRMVPGEVSASLDRLATMVQAGADA